MSNDSLKLNKQICYRVYTASRLMTRLYQPLLDELHLTYPQYVTMLVLWEVEQIDFGALGKTLNMSTGTLTPIVQKLVKSDYLLKEKNPSDDRKAIVKLSPNGKALKEKAQNIPENLAKALNMSIEEYYTYAKMLDELNEKLSQAL